MRPRTFLFAFCLLATYGAHPVVGAPPPPAEPPAAEPAAQPDPAPEALDLARAAVERFRDDEHRKRVRIDWPQEPVAAFPEAADVYLIYGYMDYTCTRFTWDGARLRALRAKARRSWFYNEEGESFGVEAFEVAPKAFELAFQAARLVLGAATTDLDPPKPGGRRGGSSSSSSHESTRWVRMRAGGDAEPLYLRAQRGTSKSNGIRKFEEIQNEAVFRLFRDLIPTDEGARRAADRAAWGAFAESQLRSDPASADLEWAEPGRLLAITSLRFVGEWGGPEALGPVERLEEFADDRIGSGYAWTSLANECGMAAAKLRLRHTWDAAAAAKLIRSTERRFHWQSDLIAWTRSRFFEADPDGYLRFLEETLQNEARFPSALRETLAELARRYPGRVPVRFPSYLDHESPDVAADVATVLLEPDAKDEKALRTLERVALDSDLTHGVRRNPAKTTRGRAIRFLAFPTDERAPLWSTERLRALARTEGEDPRVIRFVCNLLAELEEPMDATKQIPLFRGALDPPFHKNTSFAALQLIELGDRASKERLVKVLDALERPVEQGGLDAVARTVVRREIDRLRKRLAEW